jgi:heme/copper-type cytochrome/quinol oxidase subunit 2
MKQFGIRGKRIRPSDKDLVFHFTVASLLPIFLLVIGLFHVKTIQQINWQDFNLSQVDKIHIPYLVISVSVAILVCLLVAFLFKRYRERLKLTTKPEPYSFQRTLNWLSHQVAPTLKVAITLDEINQTQVVKDILDHAKLTDRHKQILKQQSVKEQDVITTKK